MNSYTQHSLHDELHRLADPAYAAFTSRLIPDLSRPLLGVRIPRLRQLARQLVRSDAHSALDRWLTADTHEELLLRALVIGAARLEWTEYVQRIEAFVPLIDNWAVCDLASTAFAGVRDHREEVWPLLLAHLHSGETYRQRYALVMMLTHYLTDEWTDHVLAEIRPLKPHGYYAAMAAAWLLQKAFVHRAEPVMALLSAPALDDEVRRLARKKLLESRQTPLAWRNRLRSRS